MNNIIEIICQHKIIPVVTIDNPEDSLHIAEALLNAGLPLIEVTFRTKTAGESIRRISEYFPEMVVGAGTVLSVEQTKSAIENGARCVVSPGINPNVVKYAANHNIVALPGVMTPTEIEQAIGLGLQYVKFFPAEAAGGVRMLKAFSGPYPEMRFMPTGGISPENFNNYLKLSNVFACGGSWMVNKSLVANKEFDKITKITKDAINMLSQ